MVIVNTAALHADRFAVAATNPVGFKISTNATSLTFEIVCQDSPTAAGRRGCWLAARQYESVNRTVPNMSCGELSPGHKQN